MAARHWIPEAAEQALPLRKTHAPRLSGSWAWWLPGQVALYCADVVAENPELSSIVRYCALTKYCITLSKKFLCEGLLAWCWANLPGILEREILEVGISFTSVSVHASISIGLSFSNPQLVWAGFEFDVPGEFGEHWASNKAILAVNRFRHSLQCVQI